MGVLCAIFSTVVYAPLVTYTHVLQVAGASSPRSTAGNVTRMKLQNWSGGHLPASAGHWTQGKLRWGLLAFPDSEVGGGLGPPPRFAMGGLPQTQGRGQLLGDTFPSQPVIAQVLLCLVHCHIL